MRTFRIKKRMTDALRLTFWFTLMLSNTWFSSDSTISTGFRTVFGLVYLLAAIIALAFAWRRTP